GASGGESRAAALTSPKGVSQAFSIEAKPFSSEARLVISQATDRTPSVCLTGNRSTTATLAPDLPSEAGKARPSCPAPPVTITTRPRKSNGDASPKRQPFTHMERGGPEGRPFARNLKRFWQSRART